jgi:hypothetical protein
MTERKHTRGYQIQISENGRGAEHWSGDNGHENNLPQAIGWSE